MQRPDPPVERLFQPFVQLDSKLSRRYEGTGMGLNLVYRVAELHGGSHPCPDRLGLCPGTGSVVWRLE